MSTNTALSRLPALGLVLLIIAGRLVAQTPAAAITGSISDTDGTVLDRVEVVARNIDTGFEYRARTGRAGLYWLSALPPGRYDITARSIGYQAVTMQAVTLAVGRTITLDFVLAPAATELEPLVVVGTRPLLETTQSDVSFVLSQEEVARLPEESRRFIDLAKLLPGVTEATSSGAFGRFGPALSAGALNAQSLGVFVDGADFTEPTHGELSGGLPLLAIQEFEVIQTTYAAEFGRAASGMVNVVTRRGSNDFELEAFGLLRDTRLNARGHFEAEKPDFSRSHWGFAAGGPITRDRTHYFVAFERKVENNFSTVETGGIFPALEGTFKTPFTDNLLFARVDHRLNDAHEVSIRYAGELGDRLDAVGPCLSGLCSFESGQNNSLDLHSVLLTHRWTLGDNLLNEARLHVIRREFAQSGNAPPGPSLCFPTICTGPTTFTSAVEGTRIELIEDLSWTTAGRWGIHRVKLGTQLSWQDNLTRFGILEDGQFLFASDTASQPFLGIVGLGDAFGMDSRNVQVGLYAQDLWSPVPDITLTLGLRYDLETNGTNQNFVSTFAGDLPFIRTTPRPIDKNNLAPRIGIAWNPSGEGRAVVRGGFGIFYDALMLEPLVALERSSGFRVGVAFDPGTTDANALRPTLNPAPLIWPSAEELKTPFTRQYSLGVEFALPADIVVRADGLYIQGRNLLIERQLNTCDPATGMCRFPQFGGVFQVLTKGEADTKMLLLGVKKSFSRGWINLNYTLADRHNTNDSWEDIVPAPLDPADDDFSSNRAPAAWDERHRLIATGGTELPFGLSLAVKAIYASARPFTALTTDDLNGDGQVNDRPPGEERNARSGPDFFRTDLGVEWNLPLSNRARIGVQLNVYNLFNTTNLQPESVVRSIESAVFGAAQNAFAGRQVEFGFRIGY